MIALTQEKREELKVTCEQIISGWIQVAGYGMNERIIDIAKVTLASLTAEHKTVRPFGFPQRSGEGCWIECNPCEEGATKFYTSPPVPEIKFPEYKRNGKPLNILAELVWAECIDEIKRLNGLGE